MDEERDGRRWSCDERKNCKAKPRKPRAKMRHIDILLFFIHSRFIFILFYFLYFNDGRIQWKSKLISLSLSDHSVVLFRVLIVFSAFANSFVFSFWFFLNFLTV